MSLATDLAAGDELCALEDAQVLQHRRAVEPGELGGEIAGRAGARPEEVEDAPSGGGGERLEDAVVVLADGARTLVTITESAWRVTLDGARNAFGNCEGWTSMLNALKAWLEHGITLREGFYR